MSTIYGHFVNLDERGDYYADVRDANENTVFEIRANDDGSIDLIEDGYMTHSQDLEGLEEYLKEMEIIPMEAELLDRDSFETRLDAMSAPEPF
ncbi:hypothetical protein GE300_20095 [Rhodobacteraceae bacterium 2CG4]|uniref:Uncharacterized protein n=1 Tax=Halovulum marinum TaxID=2662447 RepID=A0A6L5Z6Y3_9RHOB|nr:hypothetical protein [Halovulum marinum]MSU91880.1 hypothetical protein [Halovulum marinum]